MSNLVKELLMSNAYWVMNKKVVKTIGLEPAFMLGVFADGEKTLADDDGWFYQTSSTITELTGLSNHKQSSAINKLIELGVLSQENRGVPCKRYFKINYENIENLVFKNFENYSSKNSKSSFEKISNNKESNINKVNKESNINVRESILKLKELLEVQFDNKLTPTQIDKLIMLSVQYGVDPLEIYNNSDYLRGFVDRKPTWRMWTANVETTIQNMKAGEYVNKEVKTSKSEFIFDQVRFDRINKLVEVADVSALTNKDRDYYNKCQEYLRG